MMFISRLRNILLCVAVPAIYSRIVWAADSIHPPPNYIPDTIEIYPTDIIIDIMSPYPTDVITSVTTFVTSTSSTPQPLVLTDRLFESQPVNPGPPPSFPGRPSSPYTILPPVPNPEPSVPPPSPPAEPIEQGSSSQYSSIVQQPPGTSLPPAETTEQIVEDPTPSTGQPGTSGPDPTSLIPSSTTTAPAEFTGQAGHHAVMKGGSTVMAAIAVLAAWF